MWMSDTCTNTLQNLWKFVALWNANQKLKEFMIFVFELIDHRPLNQTLECDLPQNIPKFGPKTSLFYVLHAGI